MVSQTRHNELKRLAKEYLKTLGFVDEEIHEEYGLHFSTGYRPTDLNSKSLIVDVVGIKPDVKVAVECGNFEPQKIAQLNLFFDEVVVLPFMNDRLTGGIESDGLKARVRLLEEELRKSKDEAKALKHEIDSQSSRLAMQKYELGKFLLVALDQMDALPRDLNNFLYDYQWRDWKMDVALKMRQRTEAALAKIQIPENRDNDGK